MTSNGLGILMPSFVTIILNLEYHSSPLMDLPAPTLSVCSQHRSQRNS